MKEFSGRLGPVDKLLAETFGDRYTCGLSVREQHAGQESHYLGLPPDAVVYPRTLDEVAQLAALCNSYSTPLIPHGAGTSLEGHLSATSGGVCMDLTQMDEILDISPEDMLATVQAGVTREALNRELRHLGLFFSVDPGADATLGGMAATRASGTNSVRYGTMRDNVRSLTVVRADGKLIRTGTRAAKSAAGYDLTSLFIGSEGTLGIICELTLLLHPQPQAVVAASVSFDNFAAAVGTVVEAIQAGLSLARIELLDEAQIEASNAFSKLALPVRPTLFLEFHGAVSVVETMASEFQEIVTAHGGSDLSRATRPEERAKLWHARHNAYFAAKASRPGCRVWTTDVCVPISSLAEVIVSTRKDIDACGVPATIIGHVGDGNFHVLFLLDPTSSNEEAAAAAVNDEMVARAIACGGTCTGEHGIGTGKQSSLLSERGEEAVELMRQIKAALDPRGILNPGKILVPAIRG